MVTFLLDAILIAICAIVFFLSVKRGFVRTILSLVASVAAILLAVVFTPMVSEVFYDGFILNSLTDGIMATVESRVESSSLVAVLENIPEELSDILARYNVSDETLASLLDSARAGNIDVRSVCETIASPVAAMISNVLAFIVCFVVAVVVLKIAILIIDKVFKLPVLNSINKTAGIILGIVLVVVIIFVYSSVAVQLVNALGAVSPEKFGQDAIDGTIIVKFFSEHNIFGLIENVLEKGLPISK